MGGAGGAGGNDNNDRGAGNGDNGGGILFASSPSLQVDGNIYTNGANGGTGSSYSGGGGGGAGGSIKLIALAATISSEALKAQGGNAGSGQGQGSNGGAGAVGGIRIEYCDTFTGSSNPSASTQKLDCHIVEQVESAPYDQGRLNLPESFTDGRTYKVQYGRRLVFDSAGEQTSTLRVPAESFSGATLDGLVSGVGSGSLTLRLDVGDDGSWDWEATQSVTDAATLASSNLAAAFSAYWNSQGSPSSGTLDVPVRVSLSEGGQVLLTNLVMSATPPDAMLSSADITFGASSPIEGERVPITATLHNSVGMESGPVTAAFYATYPNWGEWYIGSAFVPTIGANGTAEASIIWETLGFTGTVPVRVEVDPFNRVAESNENNNSASADLTILARPDLRISTVTLSNDEPVVGESVTVTLTVHNAGQATASGQTMALFEGNPDSGGTLIGEQVTSSLSGGAESSVTFTWAPTTFGAQRLFASLDTTEQVNESNESNNQSWRDLYVGLAGPLLLDSGAADEPAYSADSGYGYLNGQASTFCGTQPEESQRSDVSGEIRYRFDHLLPGHFYHLDITLKECDGLGREQIVRVDDNQVSQAVQLGDGEAHRLSILLDPALYADHEIIITVEELIGYDAIVAEVNLHDVDYRYADSGGTDDPAYPATPQGRPTRYYGWLDGLANVPWGTLPYRSRRIDLGDSNPADDPDNELRYRFDGLEPQKHYQLNLTFFQNAGGLTQQTIYADDQDTLSVELNGQQRVDSTIKLPPATYATDGSVVVRIVRTNAAAAAFVNTIALEEETLSSSTIWPMSIQLGWNHIAWPLEPLVSYSAQSLCQEINNQGGDIAELNRFINGEWEGHICGQEFNNFTLEMDTSYFIKSNRSSNWTILGSSMSAAAPLNLQIGWNSITMPHTDAYTASSLCDDIISQGVTALEIDRWHNGGWQGHICDLPFNDFNIQPGTGYFIKATSAGTVTPSAPASRPESAGAGEATPVQLDDVEAGPFQPIRDLRVSNLRDTSVTLSWTTDEPTTGYVLYGRGNPTKPSQVALDVRGGSHQRTHYVTLTGLKPETSYDLKVISGAESDDETVVSITTAPTFSSVPASNTVYGQVYMADLADQITPATEGLVYLTLQDADGTGDSTNATLLSTLVDKKGYWHANLGNARLADGTLFDYSPSGDELLIEVQAAQTVTQTVNTAHLAPAPDIILSDAHVPTSITVGALENTSPHASSLAITLCALLMLAGTLLVWRRR